MITIPNLINSNYLSSQQQQQHQNNNHHSSQFQLSTAIVDLNTNQNKLNSSENATFDLSTGTNGLYSSNVALTLNKASSATCTSVTAIEGLNSDVFQVENALSQYQYQTHLVPSNGKHLSGPIDSTNLSMEYCFPHSSSTSLIASHQTNNGQFLFDNFYSNSSKSFPSKFNDDTLMKCYNSQPTSMVHHHTAFDSSNPNSTPISQSSFINSSFSSFASSTGPYYKENKYNQSAGFNIQNMVSSSNDYINDNNGHLATSQMDGNTNNNFMFNSSQINLNGSGLFEMQQFNPTNKNDDDLYQNNQISNIGNLNRADFCKNDLYVSSHILNHEKDISFSESTSLSSLSNKAKSNTNEKTDYENSFGQTVSKSNPLNNKKTRTKDKYRVVYNEIQRQELEKEFNFSKYITSRRKSELASLLDLSQRQIKIWFQNRRAKDRKLGKKKKHDLSSINPSVVNDLYKNPSYFMNDPSRGQQLKLANYTELSAWNNQTTTRASNSFDQQLFINGASSSDSFNNNFNSNRF